MLTFFLCVSGISELDDGTTRKFIQGTLIQREWEDQVEKGGEMEGMVRDSTKIKGQLRGRRKLDVLESSENKYLSEGCLNETTKERGEKNANWTATVTKWSSQYWEWVTHANISYKH